ncbi:MAG: hypothetical protein K0B84_05400 [Firmicutes bacterium]|nr:hypothetical protein [Bacillota bacterium]
MAIISAPTAISPLIMLSIVTIHHLPVIGSIGGAEPEEETGPSSRKVHRVLGSA